jgi:hypothetical protein
MFQKMSALTASQWVRDREQYVLQSTTEHFNSTYYAHVTVTGTYAPYRQKAMQVQPSLSARSMSAEGLTVDINYYDGRSRITDRKHREVAQVALRRMQKESYSEVRIQSRKSLDILISNTASIAESGDDQSICIWIANYKCTVTIRGDPLQMKHIASFFRNTSDNKENSPDVKPKAKLTPVKSPVPGGKRGFGIVARDLFRSGVTPDGKVPATVASKPLCSAARSPRDLASIRLGKSTPLKTDKPQSTFMGLLTAAASQPTSRRPAATQQAASARQQSPTYELSATQQQVMDACMRGCNVFYTGGAGTGKSTLLTVLIGKLGKQHGSRAVYVAATTGLAACAVGGTTLHQFAGISVRIEECGTPAELKAQHDRVVSQVG